MSYGIQLLGPSNQWAITENYRNPQLALKSTATTVAETVFENPSRLSITYTRSSPSDACLCFIAPTDTCSFVGVSESGNNITWTWFSDLPANTSVTYYVFSDAITPPADTWGIHIYDSSGNRIYSSAGKPLRLTSISTANPSWLISTDITYTTGRDYAVAQYGFQDTSRYVIMGGYTNTYLGGASVITDGINISTVYYAQSPGNGTGYDYGPMYYMVCDVTGY